jgi:type I restriction enzyme S subunit
LWVITKNIALVPKELDGQICSTGFCVIRSTGKILPEYLFYAMRSRYFMQKIIKKQHGASYPAVNDQEVFDTEILIPIEKNGDSKSEQRLIINQLKIVEEEIKELYQHNQETFEKINLLEQAILGQAFRGEL